MHAARLLLSASLVAIVGVHSARAQSGPTRAATLDPAGITRIVTDTGGAAQVSVNAATGAARFVRIPPGEAVSLDAGAQPSAARGQRAAPAQTREARSLAFLRRHARVFGLSNPDTELSLAAVTPDAQGGTHLTYVQSHRGVPVFGGVLKTHFNGGDALTAVNGTVVPDIALGTTPSRSAAQANAVAISRVSADKGQANLTARQTRLVVFRAGLLQGVPGDNHLVWEVEVGDGAGVREFVFVDAHSAKIVDQVTGIHDDLFRRAYDGLFLPAVPPSYPAAPFWSEGDAFPTASVEANNMIVASKETYDLFKNAFGRDSFDAAGAKMDSIFNRGYGCPNASWNGIFISFCNGFTTDDVTAHEWGHAYTQYTHDLIYQWQSGALNEAYSDIWGETVDLINGRGTDTPGLRADNACSTFQSSSVSPILIVNAPPAIADEYDARPANFGPALPDAGVTDDLVYAQPADGCLPLTNPAEVAGKFALIDRGACNFTIKVKNAQLAGATGVVVVNNASAFATMGGTDPTITIPSVLVTQATGTLIKANLAGGVNVTMKPLAPKTDATVRWLIAEDLNGAPGTQAFRDMYSPNCMALPARVSDTFYFCGTADGGGVHTNSGVPNHAYALIVDGGTFNGQTVGGIGLTKAAHVYYRAQTTYQVFTSDFFDHAEAIEQSCADLVGAPLKDLLTGAPSAEVITPADCQQVAKAALAVELRTPPTQCNFQPLLAKNPPDRCGPDTTQVNIFRATFESDPTGQWSVSHQAVVPADFTPRDWTWTSTVPHGGTGAAFFAPNANIGTCAPGGDESGVLHLDSPAIVLPAGAATPLLTFDHWIATEAGFDGGNLKVSVNGGPWQVVAAADYTFNAYNTTLLAAPDNTNPLQGQPAFSGTDQGSHQGSWGRSHVNLTSYAAAGDTVRLRWDLGTDGCTGRVGWYMDNVTVHACTSNTPPSISIDDISVTEGNGFLKQAKLEVSLSHAFAKPVSVFYLTFDGTARILSDYLPSLGLVTIPPLGLSKEVSVFILGDRRREADETFFVGLGFPHNGVIADAIGTCTIVNDDGTP